MNEDEIVKPIPSEIAKRINTKHFPDLNGQAITYRGGGSFSVFTVGDSIVLRLSKDWANNREMIDAFKREKLILDEIRKLVSPHQISDHIQVFEDDEIFEGVVWVTKQFNGKPLQEIITSQNEAQVASLIADFLSKLHSIHPLQVRYLDPEFSSDEEIYNAWVENYEGNKLNHFHKLTKEEQDYMQKVYERFLSIAVEMKPLQVITHGDFDHSNCMWNPEENYLQVIDCEDIGLGHAAGDFCTWYGHYGERFLMRLIEAYEIEVDKFFAERAKFYWLRIPLFYFGYAIKYDNKGFEEFGKYLLRRNMQRFKM